MTLPEDAKANGITNADHHRHADPAEDEQAEEQPELRHGHGTAGVDHSTLRQLPLEVILLAVHGAIGLEVLLLRWTVQRHVLVRNLALIMGNHEEHACVIILNPLHVEAGPEMQLRVRAVGSTVVRLVLQPILAHYVPHIGLGLAVQMAVQCLISVVPLNVPFDALAVLRAESHGGGALVTVELHLGQWLIHSRHEHYKEEGDAREHLSAKKERSMAMVPLDE